jgi:predicted RND superfamily exporter protein
MGRKSSIAVIAAVFVITALCAWSTTSLKFSYDFEAFFPQDDPETDFYIQLRDRFETDNDFFIVALENDGTVFQADFLAKVDSLSRVLASIEDVTTAIGPTQLKRVVQDPLLGQVMEVPMLRWQNPESYATDSTELAATTGLVGWFFSSDYRSVAINIRHTQKLSKARCDILATNIEQAVAQFDFKKTHVIGRALGQKLYVELMIHELILFISLSLILTTLFLYIAFRSAWGIIIPTLVVLISILWTLGFIRLLGNDLDLMLTVLPTIIFVVGMSDSVHVLTKYMQELRNGREKRDAIRYAFKSIRLATFLTAVTTSIGFLTLVLSNIKPISNFGIYTSVGIMLAYGLTYSLLPAILLLAKPVKLNTFAMSDDFWTAKLHTSFRWILRRRFAVMAGTAVVCALSLYGIYQVEVDNKMLEDLRDEHRLKQEFFFMEENFSGCRPFEMAIMLNENTQLNNPVFLNDLDTINHWLREVYGVGSLVSYTEILKNANQASNAGLIDFYTIPSDSMELRRLNKLIQRKEFAEVVGMHYNKEGGVLRIAGKIGDFGRKHYEKLNEELNVFILRNCKTKFDFRVTGTAHLIDLNNRYLVENMVWDLLLSIVVIGLIMGVVYQSPKMIILTIIPNLIPLIIVGGIMGYAGIPLKVTTSIVFNIAFGIAVDDTIHFLARVRTLLGEGLTPLYAVKRTFLTTGKAMVVTTLILSGGFLTLILSDFMGTFYIGLLISLTLFIALIAELLISPLVIIFFYKKKG